MNNVLIYIGVFSLGAAVGAAVSWRFLRTKYEKIAQEEIDSVKEVFNEKAEKMKNNADNKYEDESDYFKKPETKVEKTLYSKFLKDIGYKNESEKEEGKTEMKNLKPYVISPDEFGENDYETVSLVYYEDKVLTYDNGDRIDNVDDIVGKESLTTFGQYEDDSVFVRNDRLKKDFEVLADVRNYSDVMSEDLSSEDED